MIIGSIASIVLIAMIPLSNIFLVQAQTSTVFTRSNSFSIPSNNSTIIFGTNGTYSMANLDNDMWHFTNLRLNNSGNNPPIASFRVSAKDSNITITSCQRTNPNNTALRLRYSVVGSGEQTFNFGLDLKGGNWFVVLNGKYLTEDKEWRSLPDGTFVLTGATGNVSISYSIFSSSFGVPDTSNLSFSQQHSVAIVAGLSFAIVITIVVIIRVRTWVREPKNIVENNIKKYLRKKPKSLN